MTLVQPTSEMQLRIRSELNEDVNTRDSDLEHIKEWLWRQPHLPNWEGKWIICKYLLKNSLLTFIMLLGSFSISIVINIQCPGLPNGIHQNSTILEGKWEDQPFQITLNCTKIMRIVERTFFLLVVSMRCVRN